MIVGFTGTQNGMTPGQYQFVKQLLIELAPDEAHHGDCIGADAEFHTLCETCGIDVVVHPPSDPKKRAYCRSDRVLPELPYLDRNRDIARAVDMLIATPKETVEPKPGRGQGTWTTVRYARARSIPVHIVFPES